jgi:hypothetical protein
MTSKLKGKLIIRKLSKLHAIVHTYANFILYSITKPIIKIWDRSYTKIRNVSSQMLHLQHFTCAYYFGTREWYHIPVRFQTDYSSHNSHTDCLNFNPGLSGERPAIRRLSHSTVLFIHIFVTEYHKQGVYLCINSRFQHECSFRPPYFQPSIPVSNILSNSFYMIFVCVINRHITWS